MNKLSVFQLASAAAVIGASALYPTRAAAGPLRPANFSEEIRSQTAVRRVISHLNELAPGRISYGTLDHMPGENPENMLVDAVAESGLLGSLPSAAVIGAAATSGPFDHAVGARASVFTVAIFQYSFRVTQIGHHLPPWRDPVPLRIHATGTASVRGTGGGQAQALTQVVAGYYGTNGSGSGVLVDESGQPFAYSAYAHAPSDPARNSDHYDVTRTVLAIPGVENYVVMFVNGSATSPGPGMVGDETRNVYGNWSFEAVNDPTIEIDRGFPFNLNLIPEPASVTLVGIGIVGLAAYAARRRKRPQ